MQRYVGNPLIREALGLDVSNPDEICRNRTLEDFDLLLSHFMTDLLEPVGAPKVNSRSRKADIEAYARELSTLEG